MTLFCTLIDARTSVFCGVGVRWSKHNELNLCSLISAPIALLTVAELAETFYRGELRTAQKLATGVLRSTSKMSEV
jgi:hypothetical protein